MPRPAGASALIPILHSILVLALPACTGLFYDDRCGPEGRDVTVAERIRDAAGDSIGLAVVSMGQIRDSSPSVWWMIFSERLRDHIQVPHLVASEDPSRLFLELPGAAPPNGTDIILQGELSPYSGPVAFDNLFYRGAGGGLSMVLETDLAAYPRFVLPLRVEQFNDWGRAHCS